MNNCVIENRICLVVFCFLMLSYLNICAQKPNSSKIDNLLEQTIESISTSNEEEIEDYFMFQDELLYYSEHPLNLNKANRNEILQLKILNDFQVDNLLEHIRVNGKLLSIEELQAVEGFDIIAIRDLQAFVCIGDDFNLNGFSIKEMLANGQSQIFVRYGKVNQKQVGYLADDLSMSSLRYNGTNEKVFAKYSFRYGSKVIWGITSEKDPGEEFFSKKNKQGFDFYSAHLMLRDFGLAKAIAIGDFQVQFGQGLAFSTGINIGKTADVLNVQKHTKSLMPYTSVNENRFLRGIGTTLAFKRFEFTAFYSKKNIDANTQIVIDSINNEIENVTSLLQTGTHRTTSEVENRKKLEETICGGNLIYANGAFKIGITAVRQIFDMPIYKTLNHYNQFDFKGKQNANFGLDYNYKRKNFNFFGETARSENGSYAFLNGAIINLETRLTAILLHRNYSRNYQALFSNAFGENTFNSNENGVYAGVVAGPFDKVTIAAYCDRFNFKWLKYQVNAPSYGWEYLIQINYSPKKTLDMYARLRIRNKEKNTIEENVSIDYLVSNIQASCRYNISYSVLPNIKFKNRVEFLKFEQGTSNSENGYLIFQDIVYNKLQSPFSFSFRYALFDTDSYNTRIYAYESDVLYSFSIPAYYYRGNRVYAILQYTYKNIDVWVRYANTSYSNRNTIGSGLEEISGNRKSDIKIQLRLKF